MDLSILIEIRNNKRLPRLSGLIRAGDIAIVSYSLNRLKSAASWRAWLDRNREAVEVRLNPGPECRAFAALARDHCGMVSNPRIDEDDAMAITIASSRDWPLAIRDRAAEKVARSLGVTCITLEDLLPSSRTANQGRLFS